MPPASETLPKCLQFRLVCSSPANTGSRASGSFLEPNFECSHRWARGYQCLARGCGVAVDFTVVLGGSKCELEFAIAWSIGLLFIKYLSRSECQFILSFFSRLVATVNSSHPQSCGFWCRSCRLSGSLARRIKTV